MQLVTQQETPVKSGHDEPMEYLKVGAAKFRTAEAGKIQVVEAAKDWGAEVVESVEEVAVSSEEVVAVSSEEVVGSSLEGTLAYLAEVSRAFSQPNCPLCFFPEALM